MEVRHEGIFQDQLDPDSFRAYLRDYLAARRKARALMDRITNDQIGPIAAANLANPVLHQLFICEYFASKWISAWKIANYAALPVDFDQSECIRAVADVFALETTVFLLLAELSRHVKNLDDSKEFLRNARKALRYAKYYLGELEGNRLRRWLSVLKRRLTGQKSRGIEDLRTQFYELRSVVLEYEKLITQGAQKAHDDLIDREVDVANDIVTTTVRELFRQGLYAAQRFGPNDLSKKLVRLINLQLELIQYGSSHSTRKAFAALHLSIAYLHWGISLGCKTSHPAYSEKQEQYARRSLKQCRANTLRSLELLFTGIFRLIIGTQEYSKLPGWRRLLPSGLEFLRMYLYLRRHLII